MKKKLMIGGPLLLLVLLGSAYKLVLAPKPQTKPKKIEGVLYALANDFTLNLADGRYAKVSVALQLSTAPASGEGAAAGLPQEAVVRAIVTDTLTDQPASALIHRASRRRIQKRLLRALEHGTDEPITNVLFTDIAIE